MPRAIKSAPKSKKTAVSSKKTSQFSWGSMPKTTARKKRA